MKTKYILETDTALWLKFKSKCASQGKSMLEIITHLIKKYVGEK